ncbi:aldolase catalytic domain-containing protein [Candidatus Pelagibacter ubique]|jgi:4-hydroxy 2-oxovalerate aldolase|nr:aldolase catalytic domain-containing protein [Candidatus Pelagibacter ubique]
MKNKLKILDCTLRDGGYYNGWDFSSNLIEDYLKAMSAAKIEYVELGFRFIKKDIYLGPCAYTTASFMETLNIPKGLKVGIMINAKDIVSNKFSKPEIKKNFFEFPKKNKISFVRFACHLNEIIKIIPLINLLQKKGITTAINLMQISEISDIEIEKITRLVAKSKLDVFYFADSLGNLEPRNIIHISNLIKKYWKKDIGFHAHDNMGRALMNGVAAFNNGVNWIDTTVTGMGRGAGNIQTEFALLEFSKHLKKNVDLSLLLNLVEHKFNLMKIKYKWGTNPYYYLAGQHKIHPTFVQSMLTELNLDPLEILSALDNLKKVDGTNFNKNLIEVGKNLYQGKTTGTWDPSKLIKGKNVLIIGSGPGSLKHAKAIENFIKKNKPFVIALNSLKTINDKLINLRVTCHTLRIMSDINIFKKITQPLVLPLDRLPTNQKLKFKKLRIHNFGLEVKNAKFKFGKTSSILPSSLTIVYAIAIANSGLAKKIFVSGLDGYPVDNPRKYEMDEMIRLYLSLKKKAELISITPTRYKIKSSSVYAL